MDLVNFRVWQWMIVGVLAGSAVGYAWSNLPNDLQRTGDKQRFRGLVRQTNFIEKQNASGKLKSPLSVPLRNVVVLEPELDPSNVLVYPVTFEMIQPPGRQARRVPTTKPDPSAKPAAPEVQYESTGIYAPTPFDGNDSVIDFLKKNNVPFKDRSGAGKYVPVYYGAAAGFVGIGLLWPGAIRLMLGAGVVAPKPKKEKKPKHRTGEDVDDMLVAPTAKPVDAGALGALNDQMEKNLAGQLSAGTGRPGAATAEEPISILMSGTGSRSAQDPTEVALPKPEEEKKDYKGEYYPVVRTTGRDEKKH